MTKRPPQTLIDYLVVAIAPALIMLLIGSLVFFLIEVFYEGSFVWRLKAVTALFVFAAVLVARIAIEEGREYAGLFALPLAIVTFLALARFVDASILFDVALIGITWWCAHKLTFDCTIIDDSQRAFGEGLLQTMGIDGDREESAPLSNDDSVTHEADESPGDFRSKWQAWKKKRRIHHSPGKTVIYFAAASLPLFGIGQAMQKFSGGYRENAFRLLVVYVAAALALLMSTSFLQLRKYLRQRKLEMPVDMTIVWLGTGTIIILAILAVSMVLPRSDPDFSLRHVITQLSSPDRDAANLGIGPDGVQKKDADRIRKMDPNAEKTVAGEGKQGSEKDDNSEGGSSDGDAKSPDQNRGQDDSSKQDSHGNRESSDQPSDGGSEGNQRNRTNKTDSQNADSANNENDSQADGDDNKVNSSGPKSQNQNTPPPPAVLPSFSVGQWLKLLSWLVAAVVACLLAVRYWKTIVAALVQFVTDLRALIARLLGRKKQETETTDIPQNAKPISTPPPFASFKNPFHSDLANRVSVRELVRYTFEAFEAWAGERSCARQPDQTAVEFVRHVGRRFKSVSKAAGQLAQMYTTAAYSNARLSETEREKLAAIWSVMSGGG